MKKVYLYPGQFIAFNEPAEITTILGSCVGIALFDRRAGVGGLNHYLLPEAAPGEEPSPRYASYAIPALIESVLSLGGSRGSLEARVFGGGNVMTHLSVGYTVGDRNVDTALSMLQAEGIRIIEQNIGGKSGRRIVFSTQTFEVQHTFMQGGGEGAKLVAPPAARDIKVMIVDDSATVRHLFHKIFTKHGLQVVGAAANPFEAREQIVRCKPDVVTLDIEMPQMSGVAFLEKLMKHMPIPTVMVSSLDSQGDAALRALELGAVEFVHKPSQSDLSSLTGFAETLVEKVRAAATVNVLRRTPPPAERMQTASEVQIAKKQKIFGSEIRLVVVGGNSGSQASLQALLQSLPEDTPPVVVANSSVSTFVDAFIAKVAPKSKMRLKKATHGDALHIGNVYIAPVGGHATVTKSASGFTLDVKPGAPMFGQLPSANVLLESAAKVAGPGTVSILLGGFGRDGADGSVKLRSAGGVTVAENPENCPFPYVPEAALEIGAAEHVLNATEIAELIRNYRNRRIAA